MKKIKLMNVAICSTLLLLSSLSIPKAHAAPSMEEQESILTELKFSSDQNMETYRLRAKDFNTVVTNPKISKGEKVMLLNHLIKRSKESSAKNPATRYFVDSKLIEIEKIVKVGDLEKANDLVQDHTADWLE